MGGSFWRQPLRLASKTVNGSVGTPGDCTSTIVWSARMAASI